MTSEELRDDIVEYLEEDGRYLAVDGRLQIKEFEKTVIKALIQQAKSEWCKEQEEKDKIILKKAIILIKEWHNMGIPDNDLAEKTWGIYYKNAPEMKEIREYLNAPEP